MITSPRVFDDAHLPRELQHRESSVEALTGALEPAREGDRADDVLISGPSGVGKTVLARHSIARLTRHADVDHGHVQCLGKSTTGILRAALNTHPHGGEVAPNTPQEDVVDELENAIQRPCVLVLDEADDLPSTDALGAFSTLPLVSVVVICHDPERWLADAGELARRSLSTHIQPDRYTVPELVDILQPRANEGLEADVVTQAHLEEIADQAAGVARRGIQSLRAAAELAGERGHTQIQDEDVAGSFDRARARIRESNLGSLPLHHQVLYELVRANPGVSGESLQDAYDDAADGVYAGRAVTPVGRRSRRNKLAKLVEYDLVRVEGEGRGRTYRPVDEELTSPLDLAVSA